MTAPTPDSAPGAPGTGGTPTGQVPAGGQPQNTPPAGGNAPGAQDKPVKVDFSTLPQAAQDHIAKLNADVAEHRVKGTDAGKAAQAVQAKLDAVLKAMGLQPDGTAEPLTQEQIDTKLADASDDVWATKVENVVLRVKEVDVDKLWDSRAFVNSLDPFADLDPRSDEFATKVTAHVKKYVADHPQFKTTPPGAAKSGGDHPGGPGPGTRVRPSLGAALAAKIAKNSGT